MTLGVAQLVHQPLRADLRAASERKQPRTALASLELGYRNGRLSLTYKHNHVPVEIGPTLSDDDRRWLFELLTAWRDRGLWAFGIEPKSNARDLPIPMSPAPKLPRARAIRA